MAEVVWHQSDWQWDPIAMVAKPAESKARLAAGVHQDSQMRSTSESEVDEKHKMQNPKLAVVCQVPGCPADLFSMREYHQRYKICEFHLKAPTVLKDSRAQRFCQQCGKFQGVEEFDGDKRSCRARLDKHNARRRRQRELHNMLKRGVKLDPKAVMESYDVGGEEELASKLSKLQKAGFTLDTVQGASAGEAPAARTRPARARRGGSRATTVAPVAEEEEHKMMLPPVDTSREGGQLAAPVGSVDIASLGSATSTQQLVAPQPFAGGLPDPTATLEFLTADLGLLDDDFLDAVLAPGVMPGQAAGQAGGEFPPAPFLQVDPSQIMDLDDMAILEEITHEFGLADPGTSATPPTIPPAAPSMVPYGSVASTSTLLPPYQQRGAQAPPVLPPFEQPPAGFGLPQGLGGDMMDMAATPPAPFGGFNTVHQTPTAGSAVLPPFMAAGPPPSESSRISSATASNLDIAAGNAMSVIDEALNLLNYDTAQVTYIPEDRLFRFSAKLFNCTPDQLPSDLKASLINMLTCNSLEGYIRPGCVHVTVDALMGPEEREAMAAHGVRGVVERLVAQQPEAFWAQHTMLVQLGDKMALVREGQVVHVLATAGSTQVFPRIAALRPLVATPEADGTCRVTVWGYNLEGGEEGGDVVLARSQGKYVAVERVGEVASDPSWNGMQRMELRVAGVELGAMQIEIMRGGFISSSKTLLVHIDPLLSAELRQLESDQTGMDVDTTLFELGRVVEFGAGARTAASWGPDELSKAGKAARRMLAFAIQRKWVGVTRALLAGIAADCRALDAVAVADVMAAGTTGMPLLQLAVRTQSRELVGALLAWGRANRYSFKATTPGRRGLTSLHLAALIRDQGVIAGMITEMCDDAVSGWETAAAEDGTTPMAFAQAHGNAEVIRHLIAAKLIKKAAAAQDAEPASVPVSLSPLASKPAAVAPSAAAPAAENLAAAVAAAPSPSAPAKKLSVAAARAPAGNPASNPGPEPASPVTAKATTIPTSPKKNDKTNFASAVTAVPPSPRKPARTPTLDTAGSSSSMEQFEYVHDSAESMLMERNSGKGGAVAGRPALAPGEEVEDEIAREKAEAKRRRQRALHAHSAALTFRDPQLEAKYAKWYHSGQVPVDVAFIMIAVLSQGAWIFRWSMEHSMLGVCMVALMAMNAALVQMACLFPAKYRQYREALCVLSHIVHKVVQLLVTVTPPVGTIYSSTYNSTVAILESSSFAQVMMLSFGIKMRFAFHFFVNLFHLAVSAIVNDRICSAAWPRIPGGLCHAGLLAFQLGACFLLPCALVYLTERRSRRIFLETVAD